MDETNISQDLFNKNTLEKKGTKNVKIKTTGKEKKGYSIMLGINTLG